MNSLDDWQLGQAEPDYAPKPTSQAQKARFVRAMEQAMATSSGSSGSGSESESESGSGSEKASLQNAPPQDQTSECKRIMNTFLYKCVFGSEQEAGKPTTPVTECRRIENTVSNEDCSVIQNEYLI